MTFPRAYFLLVELAAFPDRRECDEIMNQFGACGYSVFERKRVRRRGMATGSCEETAPSDLIRTGLDLDL
jgi:hypothetical protein